MIVLKMTSKIGSKKFYNFSAVGLGGTIFVDTESMDVGFKKAKGHYENNDAEKNKILYTVKKELQARNFPDRCIYATH